MSKSKHEMPVTVDVRFCCWPHFLEFWQPALCFPGRRDHRMLGMAGKGC